MAFKQSSLWCVFVVFIIGYDSRTDTHKESFHSGPKSGNVLEVLHEGNITGFKQNWVISNFTIKRQGWENITILNISCGQYGDLVTLFIKSHSLTSLRKLEYLRIQCSNVILERNVFYGLNKLRVLDLTNTTRLAPSQLLNNLNPEFLIALEQLILVRTGIITPGGFQMDDLFWKFACKGSIMKIDISGMKVNSFNVSAMNSRCCNKRYIQITLLETQFEIVHAELGSTSACKVFHSDRSTGVVVKVLKLWCVQFKSSVNDRLAVELHSAYILTMVTVMSIENMCHVKDLSLYVENFIFSEGFQIKSVNHWNIASLSIKRCKLVSIVEKLILASSSLTYLSMTSNNMEFLHPDAVSGLTSLIHFNISNNYLQYMYIRQELLFERVLSTFSKLKYVTFARNGLSNIPKRIFSNNPHLEVIDLSENHLSTITFIVEHLNHLRCLDLKRNYVRVLDGTFMANLDVLFKSQKNVNETELVMDLSDNLLECKVCHNYEFITWLRERTHYLTSKLICFNQNGTENVSNTTLTECVEISVIEADAQQKVVIIVALIVLPIIMLIAAAVLRKTERIKKQRKVEKAQGTAMTAINVQNYEYIVFLSFSSEDALFIDSNVVPPLTRTLQGRVNKGIKPLCVGDTAFTLYN